MLDNPLNQLLRMIILNGLSTRGLTSTEVKQAYQPTQQGIDYTASVFFTKILDKRYGFLKRKDVWDVDTSQMVHVEKQIYESTFQVNALSIQDPADTTSLTASDLLSTVAAILQGDVGREELKAAGVEILRVTELRNTYFRDDRDQFEASPSFDFTVTHDQTYQSTSPTVDTIVFNIKRV